MPRQTVNSALKKLEKDGYLTLHRIAGKMGKSIQLTEKGHLLVQQQIVPVMDAEDKACSQFTSEEKEVFFATFRTLVDRLKAEVEQAQQEEN